MNKKEYTKGNIQYRFTVHGSDGSEWTTGWLWPTIEYYGIGAEGPKMPSYLNGYAQDFQTETFGSVLNDGKRTYKIETREVTYGEPALLEASRQTL